jgi:hypothetical protein
MQACVLTGAVGADQGDNLSFVDMKADSVQRNNIAIFNNYIFN